MKMDLLIRNAALLDLETGEKTCSDVGVQNQCHLVKLITN